MWRRNFKKKKFLEFGEVSSFAIMRNNDEKKTSKGFGFVSFKNPDHGKNLIHQLHGKFFPEKAKKPFYVSIAQRKEKRVQQLELMHSQRYDFSQNTNFQQSLFMSNNQTNQNQFYNTIMKPKWNQQQKNSNNLNLSGYQAQQQNFQSNNFKKKK